MPRYDTSFNFGANAIRKPAKPKGSPKAKRSGKSRRTKYGRLTSGGS